MAETAPQATANVPLGTLIYRAGLLTEEQLEDALNDGMRRGKRLGQVLVERGLLEEAEIARLLAEQRGLEFVSLAERGVDPAAQALLPAEDASLNHAVPFAVEDGVPVVAVEDPADEIAMRNVRAFLGEDVRFVVATRTEILDVVGLRLGAGATDGVRESQPSDAGAPAQAVGTTRLLLRLTSGERIEIGEHASENAAADEARRLIRRFAAASASEWPYVGRRFVRPESIVSVDVEPVAERG